ncbi:MAG: hypothetical protein EPN23_10420 [Verrucomicrobia bacterium]|nr:MAG: hypothetical protein EPN23_10420 [Verrucomicrobiota bacterium]
MVSETTKKWLWVVGLFLIVFAASAGTYWNVLQDPAQVLAFNDGNIETALSPTFHFPDALKRVWDNQFFFGSGSKQYPFTITGLGESIGPVFWRRWGPAWILGLSALAFFWMLRQYRISRPAAALAAALLAGSGVCHNFAMAGLMVRPIAIACAALALGFLEQGRRSGRWLPYAIAGGFLGLGIAEVPDVGALLALTTAAVFFGTHLLGKPETGNRKPEIRTSRRSIFGLIGKFALYVVCSGALAWQTISTMFATNVQGVTQGTSDLAEERYAWATQWSIPPQEMWNAISGSYFGRSMRSEDFPYWGRLGRDAQWEQTHQGFRNFSMCGWHWGVMPAVLILALFVILLLRRGAPTDDTQSARTASKNDRELPCDPWKFLLSPSWGWLLVGTGSIAMLLMWGKYFPLYKLFWSLPYFGTFRNPEKWNGPFSLVVSMGVAFMLDAARHSLAMPVDESRSRALLFWKTLFWAALGLALIGLLVGIGTLMNQEGFVAARLAEGYAAQAELLWNNAVMASFKVLLLAGLCTFGAWWLLRRWSAGQTIPSVWVLSAVAILALGDQFFDNRAYIQGHRYQQYLMANPLTDFLDAHRTEGRLKLMPPRHPLLNNLRLTLLQIKGYDLFEPVSVSRMPTDYAALFQALEKQPVRLWEMGALRYFLTLPGAVDELNKLDGNRGRFVERLALGIGVVNEGYVPVTVTDPQQQMLRVVEFTGALPKYRWAGAVRVVPPTTEGERQVLARIGSSGFHPDEEALLHAKLNAQELSVSGAGKIVVRREVPTEVVLEVDTTAPGWLVRSTKFDADWLVTLDGRPAALTRADFLFQAVHIPAGKHTLEFQYRPSLRATWLALAGRIGLIFALVLGLIRFPGSQKISGVPLPGE